MNMIFVSFVVIMCAYVGVKILSSEERNKVFNKRPIEVVDVKKYNQFCGWLTIGFGVVGGLTLFVSGLFGGWISTLGTVLLIVEAMLVVKIYEKEEFKMLKKR